MHFICTKEHLQKALRSVGGVAGRNPALPILRHVLVKGEHGRLRLAATDLEVGVITWVPGKVEQDGAALAVPVKQLAEYAGNLPADHVQLVIEQGTLTVRCGSAHAAFQGENAENFPLIPAVTGDVHITLPALDLITALDQTIYAAAADDTRPELSGVLFAGEGSTLTLAATDSYRLAESRITLKDALPRGVRVIVPVRAALELRRAVDGEQAVTITVGEGQLLAEAPQTHVVSRLVDGTYPDYTPIIPKKPAVTVSLLRGDLLRAARAASIFTSGEAGSILLATAPGSLRVAATTQELGETETEVPAEVRGGDAAIHFNHRFLIDALTVLPSERIRVGLTSAQVPVLFQPEGTDRTLAIVMPIKT